MSWTCRGRVVGVCPLRPEQRLDIGARAAQRLVEQVGELDRLAGARLELLAVLALHEPEGDMLERDLASGERVRGSGPGPGPG